MSEKSVKKMANLLRKGATMLDKYCPQCNGILFRLQNNDLFCPNCNQKVIIVKDEDSISNTNYSDDIEKRDNGYKNPESSKFDDLFFELQFKFVQLMKNLISRIEQTSDLLLIEKSLACIEKIISIIQKLNELKK
ncbi:MAG: hypothetical protein DRO88_06865 [Promethearchaeia archaeon]|nr:MAG: hypothetical protein DRO88_06865 [Candidatus Lokiarchaeia archaeon]